MRPPCCTPAVVGIGSRKQGNAQAQGEPNSHKTRARDNKTDTNTNTTTTGNDDNNQSIPVPGFTCLWEEEPASTHAVRDQQSRPKRKRRSRAADWRTRGLTQVVLRQGEEDGPREEARRTSKYRQNAQRTFNKLKPSHKEVINIVNREPLTGPKQIRSVKGKGGAQS